MRKDIKSSDKSGRRYFVKYKRYYIDSMTVAVELIKKELKNE